VRYEVAIPLSKASQPLPQLQLQALKVDCVSLGTRRTIPHSLFWRLASDRSQAKKGGCKLLVTRVKTATKEHSILITSESIYSLKKIGYLPKTQNKPTQMKRS